MPLWPMVRFGSSWIPSRRRSGARCALGPAGNQSTAAITKMRHVGPAMILLAFALALTGCSAGNRPAEMPAGDGRGVVLLVEEVNEHKGNAKKLSGLFASGAAPAAAALKKYDSYEFFMGDPPSVNGASATLVVRIVTVADRQEAGRLEWKFAKIGDAWKIQEAPLP